MTKIVLTKKQKALISELDSIFDLFNLKYQNVYEYRPEHRTLKLEWLIRWIARGAVIQKYTFIDELLADQICWWFFGKRRPFWALWRTKKFRLFNHHIIQTMYPLEKLRLVKGFRSLPKRMVADIEALNALRNTLSHALFPENSKGGQPKWKGKSIFTGAGLSLFETDTKLIIDYFFNGEPGYERQGRVIRARAKTEPSGHPAPSVDLLVQSLPNEH